MREAAKYPLIMPVVIYDDIYTEEDLEQSGLVDLIDRCGRGVIASVSNKYSLYELKTLWVNELKARGWEDNDLKNLYFDIKITNEDSYLYEKLQVYVKFAIIKSSVIHHFKKEKYTHIIWTCPKDGRQQWDYLESVFRSQS